MTVPCKTAIQQWYKSVTGQNTAIAVQSAVADMSNDIFGYYAVQLGELAGEYALLHDSRIRSCFSIAQDEQGSSEVDLVADPAALSLAFDNLDLVVGSHVLDCAASPHGVLREIERVLVPEGHCILIAFNPFSIRGLSLALRNLIRRRDTHSLYTAFRVLDWFEVLGFEVLEVRTVGHRYSVDHWPILSRLGWLRWVINKYSQAFGHVRLIHVQKKVSKLTPWKPKIRARPILKPGMAVNSNGHAGKTVNNSKEHG
uniref:Methyltransferase type 11 domain-containing protein n=1 Tax=uncultured Thiotrichaceae bacterium TaxID=298394 RepID=A0A6S6SLD2_9GAMM|nr:MAG: Unknown protein [uncultured Thiotrichaceae bacterium]